jgi:hypothetical protein
MTAAPKRRWSRFSISLRNLLVLMTASGLGLAWVAQRRQIADQQQSVTARLRSHGCTVSWITESYYVPWINATFSTGYIKQTLIYTNRDTYADPKLRRLFAEAREVFHEVQFLDQISSEQLD